MVCPPRSRREASGGSMQMGDTTGDCLLVLSNWTREHGSCSRWFASWTDTMCQNQPGTGPFSMVSCSLPKNISPTGFTVLTQPGANKWLLGRTFAPHCFRCLLNPYPWNISCLHVHMSGGFSALWGRQRHLFVRSLVASICPSRDFAPCFQGTLSRLINI